MKLKVIGSSSKGNAYLLENEKEALLIECGVRFDEIKKAISFNLNKIVGCILTHEHQDHCKSIPDVMGAGIKVYASHGTHEALNTLNAHNAVVWSKPYSLFRIGEFKVKAFDVKHDVREPLGFLIEHEECGVVLFLTDTYYVPYTFRGLNNIIIEANYSEEIVNRKLSDKKFLRDRVIQSHMSLETCKNLLKANDLSGVNNIVLIHLSGSNSNAEQFEMEIRDLTGRNVWVADKGLNIPFNKTPF